MCITGIEHSGKFHLSVHVKKGISLELAQSRTKKKLYVVRETDEQTHTLKSR